MKNWFSLAEGLYLVLLCWSSKPEFIALIVIYWFPMVKRLYMYFVLEEWTRIHCSKRDILVFFG